MDLPPANWRKRFDAVRIHAKLLKSWSHDIMRHSAASYMLAQTQNAAKVAAHLGHSEQVLFSNYRELVAPAQAKRFFSLRP